MIAAAKFRPFEFGVTRATVRDAGGHVYLNADQDLSSYAHRMTDMLLHWASAAPNRTLYARRDPALDGRWRHITFAQALASARSIGQALLDRGLNAQRPLAILSENSLEHALLALGAMMVGVPYCAVSPAYSLVSQDFDKLRHVLDTLTPGLVYAADWQRYGRAIEAVVPQDTEITTNLIANYANGTRATGTIFDI